jgi:hypothetical protein
MEMLSMDRRTTSSQVFAASGRGQQKDIVKQGIRLQASLGTIGAIEYLKARDISGAVITRVLADGRLRKEDRDAWAPLASAPRSAC